MKRVISLAVMAMSSTAFAQSSATLFGVIDLTMMVGNGSIANKTQLSSGGLQTSRLGFRGKEDLGGGLFAGYVLEGSIAPDSGTGSRSNTNNQASGAGVAAAGGQGFVFNRQSWVSLGSAWGEVRLGRQYTPVYNAQWPGDPSGQFGVMTEVFVPAGPTFNTITGVRASNMISYQLPSSLGGVNGEVAYFLGENVHDGAATEKDGNGYGARIGYTAGPIDAHVGYGRTTYAAGNVTMIDASGSYDFSVVKLWAGYERNKVGAVRDSGWILGLSKRMGANEFRVSYSTHKADSGLNPRQRLIGIGYQYDLSKRTAVGAAYARVKNSGGSTFALNGAATAPNASSSGLDLSIRHRF